MGIGVARLRRTMPCGMLTVMNRPTYDELAKAFREAAAHLDYCGYGDRWESECATASGLVERTEKMLKALDVPAEASDV